MERRAKRWTASIHEASINVKAQEAWGEKNREDQKLSWPAQSRECIQIYLNSNLEK
jgi:hypothetical protein